MLILHEPIRRRMREEIYLLNEKGVATDSAGCLVGRLIPQRHLGAGTFCTVDEFLWKTETTERLVAVKRPKLPNVDLLREAEFQKYLQGKLKEFKIEFCVPKVYQTFQFARTGDIWFSMEAHEPLILSKWLIDIMKTPEVNLRLAELLLQLGLFLDVFESFYEIDHRDLKVNNILVIKEPKTIDIPWKGSIISYEFPFWICFVDFGFACKRNTIDVRERDGLPTLDPCPKEGRDMFQVIVSIWYIPLVRQVLEGTWGPWVRDRIGPWIRQLDAANLEWLYIVTDDFDFKSPLCYPKRVIDDMLDYIEKNHPALLVRAPSPPARSE